MGGVQTLVSGLTRPLAHVVHIGAGAGTELALWQTAGAQTITLIEGDPGIAERLETESGAGVKVIAAVVSGDTSKRAFRRMSFADLSSLRAPTGLKELFPGLKTLSQDMVIPVDPAQLIDRDALSETGANLLMIEAPGEALGILKALEAADLLLQFDAIHLQEARTPLYDNAPPAKEIRDYLTGAGFTARFEVNPEDPERPCLSAEIDRVAIAHKRQSAAMSGAMAAMETRNSQLEEALEDAGRTALDLRAGLATLQQQSAARIKEMDAEAETLKVAQTAALAAAGQAANQEIGTAQSALSDARQHLKEQLESHEAAMHEAAREIDTSRGELSEAKTRFEAELEAAREAGLKAGAARDELTGELTRAQGELSQAKAALEAGLAAAAAERSEAQAELVRVRQDSAQRAEQVAGLRVAREEMGQEMEGLQVELGQAERAERQAGEQSARLGAEIEKLTADLTAELAAAEVAASQKTEAVRGGLTAELTAARAELATRNDQVKGLQDAREGVAQEMQSLRAELAGALSQVAQIKALETSLEAARKDSQKAGEARNTAEHRLAQAREEMLKAEGQISLIRDLLLHGPGL